ncbi:MAG: hypothetical protein O2888_04265 [Chloroflexi bacterium]|nr:hypothetical protein [Chloroflexota bacterium]
MITGSIRSRRSRWARIALVPLVAAGTLLVACSSDEEEAPAGPQTYTVNAVDYSYENLPETVRVGDSLTLTNGSATELHELVVIPMPADEERSLEELLALPEGERMALFSGMPAMVVLAAPGSSDAIIALGYGTFTTAGRYAVICGIPAGANPDEYLAAAATGEQPDVAGGPPHFAFGMYGEVTVAE